MPFRRCPGTQPLVRFRDFTASWPVGYSALPSSFKFSVYTACFAPGQLAFRHFMNSMHLLCLKKKRHEREVQEQALCVLC